MKKINLEFIQEPKVFYMNVGQTLDLAKIGDDKNQLIAYAKTMEIHNVSCILATYEYDKELNDSLHLVFYSDSENPENTGFLIESSTTISGEFIGSFHEAHKEFEKELNEIMSIKNLDKTEEYNQYIKDKFTILTIDFYNDGKSVESFLFDNSLYSLEDAEELYRRYDEEYQNDTFDGSWEEWLHFKGVTYGRLVL